jgi:hypothetical protein
MGYPFKLVEMDSNIFLKSEAKNIGKSAKSEKLKIRSVFCLELISRNYFLQVSIDVSFREYVADTPVTR